MTRRRPLTRRRIGDPDETDAVAVMTYAELVALVIAQRHQRLSPPDWSSAEGRHLADARSQQQAEVTRALRQRVEDLAAVDPAVLARVAAMHRAGRRQLEARWAKTTPPPLDPDDAVEAGFIEALVARKRLRAVAAGHRWVEGPFRDLVGDLAAALDDLCDCHHPPPDWCTDWHRSRTQPAHPRRNC